MRASTLVVWSREGSTFILISFPSATLGMATKRVLVAMAPTSRTDFSELRIRANREAFGKKD